MCLLVLQLDWASYLRHLPIGTPPQRIVYLNPLTTGYFSHPQEGL